MLQKERAEKQEIATNLRVELRHNQEFVALEEEKKSWKDSWKSVEMHCRMNRN